MQRVAAPCERACRTMRLLLASTSPARRALLDALGVPYAAEAPGVEEDVPPETGAEDAVRMLALRKARAVAARHSHALVLGADQLAEVDGQALGKPGSREEARAQLGTLLGRSHRLLTAVALVGGGDEQLELDVVTLRFHPVPAAPKAQAISTPQTLSPATSSSTSLATMMPELTRLQ